MAILPTHTVIHKDGSKERVKLIGWDDIAGKYYIEKLNNVPFSTSNCYYVNKEYLKKINWFILLIIKIRTKWQLKQKRH